MSIFPKVKHQYSGSQKSIKALIVELCMDTFVISTILPYFFKNTFSRMLFMCEMSFFKLFLEQLTFFMVAIYPFLIVVGIQNLTHIQYRSSL
jgi:hypothetical protein